MSQKNIEIKNEIFTDILKFEKKLFPIEVGIPSKDPRTLPEWNAFLKQNKRLNTYLKIGDRVFAILLLKKARAGNQFIGYNNRYEILRVCSEKEIPDPSKEIVQIFFLNEK